MISVFLSSRSQIQEILKAHLYLSSPATGCWHLYSEATGCRFPEAMCRSTPANSFGGTSLAFVIRAATDLCMLLHSQSMDTLVFAFTWAHMPTGPLWPLLAPGLTCPPPHFICRHLHSLICTMPSSGILRHLHSHTHPILPALQAPALAYPLPACPLQAPALTHSLTLSGLCRCIHQCNHCTSVPSPWT